MKRNIELLKQISRDRGSFTIQDICNLYNYIYENNLDRERATQKIKNLRNIGEVRHIPGTSYPNRYEFINPVSV